MKIIHYQPEQALALTNVFYRAVYAIDSSDYSDAQKAAWAPTPVNYQQWQQRFNRMKPYIALIKDEVAGFIELESNGHIDCLYVHPNYQRKGVASALLQYAINLAEHQQLKEVYVEASTTAKKLFLQHGFSVEQENTVIRNNEMLNNYAMRKHINGH